MTAYTNSNYSRSLFLLLTAALAFGSSSAWTFRWEDPTNTTIIDHGSGYRACTKMHLAMGAEYKWDPESSAFCVNFFMDEECTSRVIGWSCPIWGPKEMSQPLALSYLVNRNGDDVSSSSSTSSTATSSSTQITSPPTTSDTSPSPTAPFEGDTTPPTPNGGGGARPEVIAGISVGGAVAVAFLVLLCILVYRRGGKKNQTNDAVEVLGSHPPPPFPRFPELDSKALVSTATQTSSPTTTLWSPVSEMGDSTICCKCNHPHIPELPVSGPYSELSA
ncbi:hypothetical protein FQN57_005850 [Myotisia sp. PD_48]|nr:hypothetical protein FQN57_005850 [Myotisia sp. PD_48]